MKSILIISLLLFTFSTFAGVLLPSDGAGDAGGGVTIPSAKVSAQTITDFIENKMPSILLSYLNQENYLYSHGNSSPNFGLIFSKVNDLKLDFSSWTIEMRKSQPCFDSLGVAKEGAAVASTKTVCISTYLLSRRLNESNYQQQTVALLLHEISHLYGTNESQAVVLQNHVLDSLKVVSPNAIYDGLQRIFPSNLAIVNFPGTIDALFLQLDIPNINLFERIDLLDAIGSLLQDLQILMWTQSTSSVNKDLIEIWPPQRMRLVMLARFYRSSAGDVNSTHWLNKCFGGAPVATVAECLTVTNGLAPEFAGGFQEGYHQVKLTLPSKIDETPADMVEFKKFFQAVKADALVTIQAKLYTIER